MNSIIKISELEQVKKDMEVITPALFDAFTAQMIDWYQTSVGMSGDFFDQDKDEVVPNIFNLFEYPNQSAEKLFLLYWESAESNAKNIHGCNAEQAKETAINLINQPSEEEFNWLMHDARSVLDAYHLFYMYKDEMHSVPKYYNPYVVEVW